MRELESDARIIEPADWQTMPWKNGGGVTHEIFAYPPGSDFDWRLSVADVASDGPFSVFPGIARSILLLDGKGMQLSIDGAAGIDVRARFQPLDFDGGSSTHCTLLDGPVRDFNVMSRRARVRHTHTAIDRFPCSPAVSGDALVLFCLHGEARLQLTRTTVNLPREHTIVFLKDAARLKRVDAGAETRLLLLQFTSA